ncbi:hypothetical protein Droror1_Dr00022093 [Drosera rotundifolia]
MPTLFAKKSKPPTRSFINPFSKCFPLAISNSDAVAPLKQDASSTSSTLSYSESDKTVSLRWKITRKRMVAEGLEPTSFTLGSAPRACQELGSDRFGFGRRMRELASQMEALSSEAASVKMFKNDIDGLGSNFKGGQRTRLGRDDVKRNPKGEGEAARLGRERRDRIGQRNSRRGEKGSSRTREN